MKVYDCLLTAAQEEPGRIALEFAGREYSYGAVAEEAGRVAAALRREGVGPGEAVGLMLPNLPEFVTALFGTFINGGFIVPFNVLLRPPEIRYLCEDSGVRLIFVYESFLPQVLEGISELASPPKIVVIGKSSRGQTNYSEFAGVEGDLAPHPTHDDSPVMTLYTSGTTGKPKGAVITNRNLIANLKMMDEVFIPKEGDKALCVLPLFHCFALNAVLIQSIKNRSTVVLHAKFEVEAAIKSLAEDRITAFSGVPTMYFYILKQPGIEKVRFPDLRYCVSGGAAMPVEVMKEFESRFNVPVLEGFGLTETTVSVCCNRPDRIRKAGSIGQPYTGVEMKIVDDMDNEVAAGELGELIVKAPNVMKEYLNKPEATADAIRDGWFHTGDIGYTDEDGFFFIVDRKKDMIIKGGYNIYPREIEEVIYQLPQIAEAAVVGVFDEAKGEVVRAVIALKPGQALPEEALRAHVEANLAKYKHPQDYTFVEELPKGPTGKILKREIRQQWQQWNRGRAKPEPVASAK